MIRCPICKSIMLYKNGESKGRKYEFYGCSRYPNCRGIVEMDELEKYDDGIQSNRIEKTVEEEGDDVMNIFYRKDMILKLPHMQNICGRNFNETDFLI